jgi:SEC-C motif
MGEAERLAFVFGTTVDLDQWQAATSADRGRLIDRRFPGLGEAPLAVCWAVIEQLVSGDPSEVWATARRLFDDGASTEEVLQQLSVVFAHTAVEAIERGAIDEAAYAAGLERLPLPDPARIEDEVLAIAASSGVMSGEELIALTTERLGWERGDQLVTHLVEHVEEDLADRAGPLAWLPGDRTVHVATLCQGIVLTHVLTPAERGVGALTVSFDLAGFARVDEVTFEGQPLAVVSAEPGHLAWMGPEGWLDRFDAGTVLAVRVDAGGDIRLDPLPASPAVDPDLVAALRRVYDNEVEEPELPVPGEDLVLGLLAEDRAAFGAPQAPLEALCEAAGLDRRASEVAHDPDLWENARIQRRVARVSFEAEDDTELANTVLDVVALLHEVDAGAAVDPDQIRDALDELEDLDVLGLVADEVFGDHEPVGGPEAVAARLVAAARRPAQQANARLLAALAAELELDWSKAERHLELAAEADPSNVPAADRLAWYASDRGDAARALKLWHRCPRSFTIAQGLDTVEPFARPAASKLGRNDRCWCGSGRKFKQCHLGIATPVALPDRVRWLCRKAVGYLERVRPAAREALAEVAAALTGDDLAVAVDDPLVPDLVLTEGGWFRRFLNERGELLPDDEALLAASWMTVDRTVYEITATTPGAGLAVRDLRTGDELDIRERTFPHTARPGTLVCARAVPDGETRQFVGGIFPVAPGTEAAVLDLLDEGDPLAIAAWVRDLRGPPELRTRENEHLVECEIVVTTDDVDRMAAHLDATYDNDVPCEWWTEHHDLDEIETVARARFHLAGDRLTVTTNSNERADRILARLRRELDVTVVADRRVPMDADTVRSSKRFGLPDLPGLAAEPSMIPEEAITEIQEQMEDRWCGERVPALGGLTPWQAAADPTRREQLERLLASFDAKPMPPGAFTMRTGRLRTLLGL